MMRRRPLAIVRRKSLRTVTRVRVGVTGSRFWQQFRLHQTNSIPTALTLRKSEQRTGFESCHRCVSVVGDQQRSETFEKRQMADEHDRTTCACKLLGDWFHIVVWCETGYRLRDRSIGQVPGEDFRGLLGAKFAAVSNFIDAESGTGCPSRHAGDGICSQQSKPPFGIFVLRLRWMRWTADRS